MRIQSFQLFLAVHAVAAKEISNVVLAIVHCGCVMNFVRTQKCLFCLKIWLRGQILDVVMMVFMPLGC